MSFEVIFKDANPTNSPKPGLDPLTGLANRGTFTAGSKIISCSTRRTVAVLVIDLDGFKDLNDTLGQGLGDDILQAVAQRLSECVGQDDCVALHGCGRVCHIVPSATGPRRRPQLRPTAHPSPRPTAHLARGQRGAHQRLLRPGPGSPNRPKRPLNWSAMPTSPCSKQNLRPGPSAIVRSQPAQRGGQPPLVWVGITPCGRSRRVFALLPTANQHDRRQHHRC